MTVYFNSSRSLQFAWLSHPVSVRCFTIHIIITACTKIFAIVKIAFDVVVFLQRNKENKVKY